MLFPDFATVLAAARTGDRAALDRLLTELYPAVRELVHTSLATDLRRKRPWLTAMFSTGDVVQDVFCGVIRGLDDFHSVHDGAFVKYLATMVKNRLVDAVRFHEAARRDGRKQIEEPTAGLAEVAADGREATPTLAASLGERAGLVREALAELPERHRRLLELRLLEDATFPAIREALGYASDETARQAFHDAQARLLVKLRLRGFGRTQGG